MIQLPVYAGGGWVWGKNKGYIKVAQNMIRSPYFFARDGSIEDIPTTSLFTTSLYGEFGLSDKLSVIAYIPFFVRSTKNERIYNQSKIVEPGQEINSFGDTDISLKYGFFQDKPIVLAASLTFGIPFGFSDVREDKILQTGDGEFNQLIKLAASHSFYPKPFYMTTFLGFNNRTNGFSDEFHFGGEIGWTPGKFAVIMKIYSLNSLYNGDGFSTNANGVFANNTEYFSYTPELIYQINNKMGVSASAGLALSGKRILAAPNFGVGAFIKLYN